MKCPHPHTKCSLVRLQKRNEDLRADSMKQHPSWPKAETELDRLTLQQAAGFIKSILPKAQESLNGRRLTNAELAATDQTFRKACELAGQHPSRNRYRRFKYGRGEAYLKAVEHGLLTHPVKNG